MSIMGMTDDEMAGVYEHVCVRWCRHEWYACV